MGLLKTSEGSEQNAKNPLAFATNENSTHHSNTNFGTLLLSGSALFLAGQGYGPESVGVTSIGTFGVEVDFA